MSALNLEGKSRKSEWSDYFGEVLELRSFYCCIGVRVFNGGKMMELIKGFLKKILENNVWIGGIA